MQPRRSGRLAASPGWISIKAWWRWPARSRPFRGRHRLYGSRVVHWPCICPTRCLTSCCVSKGFNSVRTDQRPYARCDVCWCRVAGCSSVYGQARLLIASRCGTPSSGMSGPTRRQRSGRAGWARIPRCCRQLMAQTGFRDVQIRVRTRTTRLPAVAEFVLRHLAASPVAGAVDALPNSAREALAEEVSTVLRPYGDGEGVALPDTTNVVLALR